MRIRKQASKLLGWAHHSQFRSSSSPPPPEADSGEMRCRLNLSPWDAVNSPHCTIFQDDLEAAYESPEIGAAGDEFKAKEIMEEEQNEESEEETKSEGAMKCKKTDGKRWHCNRAAKLPHSLCGYHLAQLRSYRARFEDQVAGHHRKKSPLPADCGGAASNYYYYYSILGPWWGKRRVPVHGEEGGGAGCSDSSESASSPPDSNGEAGHEEKYAKKKKKRVVKRRGRKPVKSRSLKSLL